MKIEYSTNNSGGSWWLEDKDWIALEAAGWRVQWGGLYFCRSKYQMQRVPEGKPEPCQDPTKCHGHRRCDTPAEAAQHRYMGALAHDAEKDFETPGEAMREFERLTGQKVSDEGCNCCGPPHSFSWFERHVSGEGCLAYLFPDKKIKSLREMLEEK